MRFGNVGQDQSCPKHQKTGNWVTRNQKLGIRILSFYPPTLQGEVWVAHPDWRRIPTAKTTIPELDMKKIGHGGMLYPLGPYGDFFIDVLAEILRNIQLSMPLASTVSTMAGAVTVNTAARTTRPTLASRSRPNPT